MRQVLVEETRGEMVNLQFEVLEIIDSIRSVQANWLRISEGAMEFMTPTPYSFLKGMCLVSENMLV